MKEEIIFSKSWFLDLDERLRVAGLDSDSATFDEILSNLQNPKKLNPDEFASNCAYVILAGGFSQKTAKKVHEKVMEYLKNSPLAGESAKYEPVGGMNENSNDTPHRIARRSDSPARGELTTSLLKIFNNKNKINAIVKIWQNRGTYTDDYYRITNHESRITHLSKLPHIGKITANHLARNLGENVVKYDIWIQRLGCIFAMQTNGGLGLSQTQNATLGQGRTTTNPITSPANNLQSKINNGALNPDIKIACDEMFAHLSRVTGLPIGYIDVVLWKACQNGMIKL